MDSLLSVKHVGCERGGILLFQNLNFSIYPGEIVQLSGPNGSGKTTLLRFLAGLSFAYDGEIAWLGNIQSSSLYIGHKPGIKIVLSAVENLRWYFPDRPESEILRALQAWGLAGHEEKPCYELSVGQRQRVALTRLLLSNHVVWLLDEPFTSLDHKGIQQLETLLINHAQKGGAVILTSHHKLSSHERMRQISLQEDLS